MSTPQDDEPPPSSGPAPPSSTSHDQLAQGPAEPSQPSSTVHAHLAPSSEDERVRTVETTAAEVQGDAYAFPEHSTAEAVAEHHGVPHGEVQREEGPGEHASIDLASALSGVGMTPTSASPSHDAAPSRDSPVADQVEDIEEEWSLKTIGWPPLPLPPSADDASGQAGRMECGGTMQIICQNKNGPCSLLALCNILLLRSSISIPPSRTSVSYSYLSSLLADYLLRTSVPSHGPNQSLSSALSILPSTRYGLSLNPTFGNRGFKPSSSTGAGELSLFSLANVELVHGWLVEPTPTSDGDAGVGGEEYEVLVGTCGDYDKALERVVEGDVICGEEVAEDDEEGMLKQVARRSLWTADQERIVRDAHIIRTFLSSTPTQLTYPGLYALSSTLPSSSLTALFRNSHLSVLYRRPSAPSSTIDAGPTLFTLVTDSSLMEVGDVVWESLVDVDGGGGEFYDGALRLVRGGAAGDWVGPGTASNDRPATTSVSNDEALARQLQYEDDTAARQEQSRRDQQTRNRPPPGVDSVPAPIVAQSDSGRVGRASGERKAGKAGKKDKCVVM